MLLLPNFQRTFRLLAPCQTFDSPSDFFDRVAKVWAFIISTKFFCYFSKIFSSLSEPEDLKNCCFFEAGCKVTTSYHFNQIFLSDFEDFFLLIFTRTFEELFAFFRSGRQRYEEYFYQQIFLFISFNSYPHFYSLSACHLQRTCPFCHSLYPHFLSSLPPFTGVSVSNRVAKIESSTSLPNNFRYFFLLFPETRYQQRFHGQKKLLRLATRRPWFILHRY